MQYLISGEPRTRSAWMCALINAHGSRCFHDALIHEIPLNIDAGIADPGLAMDMPEAAIAACIGARLHVFRDDWQKAYQDWLDFTVPRPQLDEWERNLDTFRTTLGAVEVPMAELDDDDAVGELVTLCTHKPASKEIIQIFQPMKIEQHIEKLRCVYAPLASAFTV